MSKQPGREPAGDGPAARGALGQVPVIAIGASAGGLEAMKDFLGAMPADLPACLVFIQHLDPGHKSMLSELLARCTEMPVEQAEDGMPVAPGRLIVIPPDATLTIRRGVLRLQRPAPPRIHRTPIDSFLQSLAADQGDRSVAIILSGTGSDGTQGLKAVKEVGGVTIVQDPATAKYDSMPRNAGATGLVDQVLAADRIPGFLAEYLQHIRDDAGRGGFARARRELRDQLSAVCTQLKLVTGHDFRHYKEPTLIRRVQRRMQVLRTVEINDYVQLLRDDKKEVRQLFRELLVSVTGFFRDPEAFAALERVVLPALLDSAQEGATLRIWVPGCATGEEAYSIAMALLDKIEQHGRSLRLQVFATDLDEAALEVARRATYPESIAAYVPQRLLKRYFHITGGEYQVSEEVRALCIFSSQSLVKDPPFSRLDLISCRNVLIYLKSELQNRLVPVFHYALRPGGFLFLGTSENLTRHSQLFETVDPRWRIFRRRETDDRPRIQFPLMELLGTERTRVGAAPPAASPSPRDALIGVAERTILDELGPAYAIVNESRELVFSGGRIETFLKLQRGAPSFEVLTIAHPGLRMDIRALLHRVSAEQLEVRREGVSFETAEGHRRVTMVCRPLRQDRSGIQHYLLVFHDLGPASVSIASRESGSEQQAQVQALESELRATKEYLQTTTEELESSNEELKSANEELMSMNEELQSSNEELETSKEELQSVNEELETVNAELASKVDELASSHADLQNLLESTQIATMFLDRGMRVRRFTPVAKEIFRLIDSDLGRPITDITPRVQDVDLAEEARAVFEKLTPVEREVTLRDGKGTFMMRLLPYRTPGEVIEGVVVTFVDVTRLKKAQQEIDGLNAELQARVDELEVLLDLAPIGIAFADDPECKTITVNRYGARIMKVSQRVPPADNPAAGYRFVRDGVEIPAAELPLQASWRTGEPVHNFRATYVSADGSTFEFLMSSAPILDEEGRLRRVIGVYDDITQLVEAQAAAETRAAQQDFVATAGNLSLRGHSAEQLIEMLPEELARVLRVEFAKILAYRPETGDFSLEASVGFDKPPGTFVGGGMSSQAGYTIQSATPVIVENLAEERRFDGPPLLREAGVVSGMSVLIGDPEEPWGVLGVHSRTHRGFSADDVKFLQSVANILAATLQRDAWGRHQRLLLDELRHRVKNSLATVQAIASLSFRQEPITGDVVSGFIARLHALSQAQDLHLRSDGKDIDFKQLLYQQIEPYDTSGARIKIRGRAGVRLPPSLAMDTAMVLHELVTNAIKHGSLAHDDGRVDAAWRVESRNGEAQLVFDWQEHATAPLDGAPAQGIGTKLLQAIARQPNVNIERSFMPDGLRCRIEIRLNRRRIDR